MRILLWLSGTAIGVKVVFGALRRSRRDGIDLGEALTRMRDELQAEIDEEAARKQWRRDLMKDLPPPP